MKLLLLLVFLLAVGPMVRAQQIGLIANTDGRKTTSLNGQWQTIIDPYESGYYNYRYQPSDNGYFKNTKPKSKTDLIEYDFDSSAMLNVPGGSEIPVYWTIQWENPATLENARNQLGEMIARDKNRAAVVIWSVANETPLSDVRLTFLKNLITHARSLDATRLMSAAME